MPFLRLLFLIICVSFIPPLNFHLAQAQEVATIKAVDAAAQEDQTLQLKVRNLLKQLPEYQNVFVTVKGGVVTLKGRVLELDDVTKAEELAAKIDGVVTVNNQIDVETSVEKRLTPAFERFQERLAQFISALPIMAVGLIVFAIVTVFGFLIARMNNPWNAIAPNQFVANLLRQIIRLAFIILGLVLALDIMGATALLSTILGAAGILGLALGFAVKDTVENYIASILLSFRQPFRPRDCVEIAGHEGYVIALTSRATILLTYDGNHVRIPNATVFKGVITNFSRNPERRFSFTIGVESEDLKRAVSIGLNEIRKLSFVLKEPAADGRVDSIGDSSINLWFGGWINQNDTSLAKAKAEAIRKVKRAFEAEGISMPEPIYRVRFDNEISMPKTQSKPKAVKKRPAKLITDDGEQDVSVDKDLQKRLIEEEERNVDGDLLDTNAPQEIK
ncbi:MAG: mechanosensitive ion channel family protein [Rhizobiaceae bacterium]